MFYSSYVVIISATDLKSPNNMEAIEIKYALNEK